MRSINVKWGFGIGLVGLAAVWLDTLILEKYFFRVKHLTIGKNGSGIELKLLLLTDIHFVKKLHPYQKKLAHRINTLHPDLLLVTGDIIDQKGELAPAKQFFNLLAPNIMTLAIAGNHDYKNEVSIRALEKVLQKKQGLLLINETKQIIIKGTTLTITGVDDFIEGDPNLDLALETVGKEDHHILLIHSPLQQEVIQKKLHTINQQRPDSDQINLQYIFAGHNHGGQVRFGPIIPVLPEKSGGYVDGWYNEHPPFLYISKGFGTSGVPFRFGACAEIVMFHYGV